MPINKYGDCPECGKSWDGGDIPIEIRVNYAPPYKWSRLIGIQYGYDNPNHWDGVSEYMCPDCKTRWNRFTEKKLNENEVVPRP